MDEVSQVREKIDIVSLISEYLPLKKMGRNFKANCPFHSEKTPSFVVSPERQIWHCFGCGKGGDVFTFLMEYEHMEFPEALRTLAKKAGVVLKQSVFQSGVASQKEKIYSLNSLAAEFYHFVLTKHPVGKNALDYLLHRGLNAKLIDTFQIGFAPKSGTSLTDYLIRKKGYKKEELFDAGLAFQNGVRTVDFFRDRIMFALSDQRGNIVGFSGRVLFDNSVGPKYINSRETLVYHKGDLFFGMKTARDAIKRQEQAIVVEGEFDAISMFAQGFANTVAIKGTALTENQVTVLSRLTPKVTLCFDQDSAGFEATKRSVMLLEKKGLTTTVIVFDNAKDADEAIQKDAPAFKKAIKHDVPVYDFLLSRLTAQFNKNTAEGKKKIADELLPLLSNIDNEIVKEHYIKKVSGALDTSVDGIARLIERLTKREVSDRENFVPARKKSRIEILENYLTALFVQSEEPKKALDAVKKILGEYTFSAPVYEKILAGLQKYSEDRSYNPVLFAKTLPSELLPFFDTAYLFPLPKFADSRSHEREIEKVAGELSSLFLKKQLSVLTEEIKKKEAQNADAQKEEKEFALLTARLQQSKN